MHLSLLSRDPLFAFRLGGTRVTVVAAEPGEAPSVQFTDPTPQNSVVNNPLELVRLCEDISRRGDGQLPHTLMLYNEQDEAVTEVPLWVPVGRVTINFLNLGSASAALILLLTGSTPAQINWEKVIPSQMTGNPKAPEEVEAFLRWHLKG